jgi:hypothetical protein
MKEMVLAAVACLAPSAAAAVCVVATPTPQSEMASSEAVVIGHLATAQDLADKSTGLIEGTKYTVAVDEVLKGHFKQLPELYNENNSGRFVIDPGVRYLLFIEKVVPGAQINSCGNSGPLAEKQRVVAQLRKSNP